MLSGERSEQRYGIEEVSKVVRIQEIVWDSQSSKVLVGLMYLEEACRSYCYRLEVGGLRDE